MSKIKIVHCADVHLGTKFSSVPEIADVLAAEQLEAFEKIINRARSEADILLIAGDLFHSPTPDLNLTQKVIELLEYAAVPVFITPGNHDPATPDSVYCTQQFPSNVHIFKSQQIECIELGSLGVRVYGAGFCNAVWREGFACEKVAQKDDVTDILILHADLNGGEQSPYNPVSERELCGCGFDYIALGHIHKSYITNKLAYSGCPVGTGFDEVGNKGYIFAQIEKGANAKVDFISSQARRFIITEIGADILNSDTPEELLGGTARDIYRLKITDNINFSVLYRFLKQRLFHFQLVDDKYVFPDIDLLAEEQSLRGAFVRRLFENS